MMVDLDYYLYRMLIICFTSLSGVIAVIN